MQQRDRWSDLNNPYRYRDENLRRLGFRDYAHYLRSPVWVVIRQKVLERDRTECARCGKTATQVHHRAYDTKTLTGECLHALSSLCRTTNLQTGEIVVEDVKSDATRTEAYRLRKKLVEAIHGITVTEV